MFISEQDRIDYHWRRAQRAISIWQWRSEKHTAYIRRKKEQQKKRLLGHMQRYRRWVLVRDGTIGFFALLSIVSWSFIAAGADQLTFADRSGALTMITLSTVPFFWKHIRRSTCWYLAHVVLGRE